MILRNTLNTLVAASLNPFRFPYAQKRNLDKLVLPLFSFANLGCSAAVRSSRMCEAVYRIGHRHFSSSAVPSVCNSTISAMSDTGNGYHSLVIALGSNMGGKQRLNYIEEAMTRIQERIGPIWRTSSLYETTPAYGLSDDQPNYLNAVIQIKTKIDSPKAILCSLQTIELELGREKKENRAPNSNRPIDLDILFFDDAVIEDSTSPSLCIPHACLAERNFVLFPLCDILPHFVHPRLSKSIQELLDDNIAYGKQLCAPDGRWTIPKRCFPIRDQIWYIGEGSLYIVGILNVSPDSFSDNAGQLDVEKSVERALMLIEEGADIIDIGGVSTAPGRLYVSEEIELQRLLPTVKELRKVSNIPISIDTRSSYILERCLDAGADMINDISSASSDAKMIDVIHRHRISAVFMHMRGDASTMDRLTDYEDVVLEVGRYLRDKVTYFEAFGIPRWRMALDVGLGFSKSHPQNFQLIKEIERLRSIIPSGIPLYYGFSRKRYIGSALNQSSASSLMNVPLNLSANEIEERKWGGAAIVSWCTLNRVDFIRTHDVKEACCVRDTMKRILSPQ